MRPRALGPGEPERIGGYRLTGVLGEGGQGVVYLGEGPSGGQVAVKVLHSRAAADSESQRRFLREAETARRVALFCTARVLDAGTSDDRPYVVSEYIPGVSLAEAVATGGPRGGSGLQRLAVATVTALAAIHRAGIVHRDFKPSNVILGPEGPVVIDFGIARELGHATTSSGLIGTPAYISPEQLAGQTPGTASDLFSWAATMVYAATGHLAFPGATIPTLLFAISTADPDLTGVPSDLHSLLASCLAKDPAIRPTAAQALRHLTGEDIPTAPVSGPPPAAGPAQTIPATPHPATATSRLHPDPVPGTPTYPVRGGPDPATPTRPADGAVPSPSAERTRSPATPGATAAEADTTRRAGRRPARRRLLWPVVAVGTALVVTAGVLVLRPVLTGPGDGAPSGGTLLYGDDFGDRGNWDGYTFNPGASGDERTTHGYEIERGVYSIYADKDDPFGAALSPVPPKNPPSAPERNVLIGVTTQVREGSTGRAAYGLLCRWDEDTPNGYLFLLGLDGTARVVRNAQGTRLDLVPPVKVAAPRPGQDIRLQARCDGSGTATRLTFWVDGTRVLETADPTPPADGPHSQAGLVAQVPEAGGGTVTVSFDDFSVRRAS
ncbi:protein kinase domain-containing protein [Sphaerisporangium aureirubrum]|uniref:Protein kinase n=1 Tax=Sphaerisporangium aureirubrum TaxID=1544736 RepID=A0ABW1NQI8_9ACTN